MCSTVLLTDGYQERRKNLYYTQRLHQDTPLQHDQSIFVSKGGGWGVFLPTSEQIFLGGNYIDISSKKMVK